MEVRVFDRLLNFHAFVFYTFSTSYSPVSTTVLEKQNESSYPELEGLILLSMNAHANRGDPN